MSTETSHPWFTVRFVRWCWRMVWSRRMIWTLVCFVSLLVLYYQWENWRSARELEQTRQRIVARLGTDNMLGFAPPKIPDEQNYFANPVIESWIRPSRPGANEVQYIPPPNVLLPKDTLLPPVTEEPKDGDAPTLDLAGWAKQRAEAGKPLPADLAPEVVLARELGDGNGLLPKLAEGVNKPFSMMKPGRREAIEAANGNPWAIAIPNFRNMNDFQRQLALHLRSAALVHDQGRVRDTALIMLRFSEAGSKHALVGCLVSLALHGIALEAMHDSIGRDAWSEPDLLELQRRLVAFDDLQNVEHGLASEALALFQTAAWLHAQPTNLAEMIVSSDLSEVGWRVWLWKLYYHSLAAYGPIGWHDANVSYWTDRSLDGLGPAEPTAWLTAGDRYSRVSKEARGNWYDEDGKTLFWLNPRRFIGAIAMPNIGNLFTAGAQNLFHRRCLIIGATLERYRLRHGRYPESLEVVQSELAPFKPMDPARPGKLPGYRLEPTGYLLWSAGDDGRDDGGAVEKDWRWRLRTEGHP